MTQNKFRFEASRNDCRFPDDRENSVVYAIEYNYTCFKYIEWKVSVITKKAHSLNQVKDELQGR